MDTRHAPSGPGRWIACAATVLVGTLHGPDLLAGEKAILLQSWIWAPSKGRPASVAAPPGSLYVRRVIDVDKPPVKAACRLSVDNAFVLYVNGTRLGEGKDWTQIDTFDLTPHLKAGPNVVAIEAQNWGPKANPAGMIGYVRLVSGDGADRVVHLDGSWRVSTQQAGDWTSAAFDDSTWAKAQPVGRNGCAPWGVLGRAAIAGAAPHPIDREPETKTLDPERADAMLVAEWLFQADRQPLAARALQEITWGREMAARLAERPSPPDLDAELRALAAAETRLKALPDGGDAEGLYVEVRRIKRRILFKDPLIDFDRILFTDAPERYPHESMHRVYPQAQLNCVRLLLLDGLHPGGRIRKVTDDLGPGWYWRPDVSFDATRILFCFRPGKDRTFHLYEVGADGSGLRQLTDGQYDDMDPVYMPAGYIVFLSNRGNSYARCVVGHPSTVVARCDADGRNIYLISAGNEPEYTPALMPNGQVLYTRWEYTDKELMRIQSLWTMNPDGTGTTVYYGNQSYWPDMLVEARPIPGSHRVMFAGHGHHQMYWGSIGIVDPRKGLNYPDGLTKVTPDVPWCEVGDGPHETPETPRYHRSGDYRGYKTPYPLSEEVFLVSARAGGRGSQYKIFLMDVYGNRELIYAGAFHALYAMPVRPRATPPVIPDRVTWAGAQQDGGPVATGTFYSPDVYQGTPKPLHGRAKYLRIINPEYNTSTLGKKIQDVEHAACRPHMHVGPVVSITVNDHIKRVLGVVPVEADGSVYFEVPPCKPLHFQLLDEHHRCLQTMRSFTSVMPGERRGCVGCHEMQRSASIQKPSIAMRKGPARPAPYPWGPVHSLGYERDIQPILDRSCGACHQGQGKGRKKLDLTLRPSPDAGVFPEPYVTLTLGKKRDLRGHFPAHCEGGIAGTILAEAQPWRPQDYTTLPPMTTLSYTSPLVRIAMTGACPGGRLEAPMDETSRLTLIVWVDTLCAYRGEYELRTMDDPDPDHPLFKRSAYPPSDPTIRDVYAESPYRPRMRTAPVVNRAYRQDEFPTVESRLPRDAQGRIIPPIGFTPDGRRIDRTAVTQD